jgi:hypothetical protein
VSPEPAPRFQQSLISDLDEPVQRFFTHAIRNGAVLGGGVRLTMTGRIKVGTWLPFTRSKRWTAARSRGARGSAWDHSRVIDRYAHGAGRIEGRLLGRVALFHADDANTTRSAAARAALESVVFAPTTVLPQRGVAWRADGDDVIVGRFDLAPEHPEVHARIDERGALVTMSALRWGNAGRQTFDYIPCECEVHAERRFGDLLIPNRLTVGWWFDTPRYAPFFKAHIHDCGHY